MSTITDFDELRMPTEPLDVLEERTFADVAGEYDLPDVEPVDGELFGRVVPIQDDEFRCGTCYLVLHRTLHYSDGICRDCA